MFVKKEQRMKLIDCLEAWCETSRLSKKTLGNTMRSYHIASPFFILMILFYSSQWFVTIVAMQLICAFILLILFNGCVLSMLEHRLCGDEFTVADPFVEMFGLELNNENRIFISHCIAITYFAFFFLIYYYRFYYNVKTS
jgi:hypothetical protein